MDTLHPYQVDTRKSQKQERNNNVSLKQSNFKFKKQKLIGMKEGVRKKKEQQPEPS